MDSLPSGHGSTARFTSAGDSAVDGAGEEGLHLVVDLATQPADLALEMPVMPIACTRSPAERVETPCT